MSHYLRSWAAYMKTAIRHWNEYKSELMFISLSSFFVLLIGVLNIEIIFSHVETIAGWSKYEILWALGYFHLVKCFFSSFFINVLDMSYMVQSGRLDTLRTRPLSVPFQLMCSERYNTEFPIDELVIGIVLLIWSGSQLAIAFTFTSVLFMIVLLIASVVVYACMVFILSSISLWTVRSNNFFELFFTLEELNQYPLSVYGVVIQNALTFIIPLGFVSFLPNLFILGKEGASIYFPLTIFVAGILFVLSVIVWKRGIAQYESPNS